MIPSTAEYARLLEAAQAANQAMPDPLAELRRRFDERLAALDDEQAGDRLRDLDALARPAGRQGQGGIHLLMAGPGDVQAEAARADAAR